MPASRYVFYPLPWYSVCIVVGAALAIWLAVRGEKSAGLPKDTVVDLALWLLPCGILGARLYYVVFSWEQFRDDPISILRIWEGGLAIYGGLLAGLMTLLVFCRVRKLKPLVLCDLIAPGVALAQAIGRWGNYFNMEAYGLPVQNASLCFFPLAVQIPSASGVQWHLATFFYESVWNLLIFLFLIRERRRILRKTGDVFFLYAFLYGAGRLVIEEMRMDSLYALGTVRISQLLALAVCGAVSCGFFLRARRQAKLSAVVRFVLFPLSCAASLFALWYALGGPLPGIASAGDAILPLCLCSLVMTVCLLTLCFASREDEHAHHTP